MTAPIVGDLGPLPPLVLGSVAFTHGADDTLIDAMLTECLARGVNWIDTAAAYNDGDSEAAIGRILHRRRDRDQVVLATKFGLTRPPPRATADQIANLISSEVEGSLRRLRTDRIDLLQLHRPWFDIDADVVLSALNQLLDRGHVRAIGASNFPAWMLEHYRMRAEHAALPPLLTQQVPYNLLDRRIENESIPYCRLRGFPLMTWSPTASGLLSGRYVPGAPPPPGSRATWVAGFYNRLTSSNLAIVAALGERAAAVGLTPPQFAIAWARAQPGVSAVIIGPRTAAHLADALQFLDQSPQLPTTDEIDAIVPPGGYVVDLAGLSRPTTAGD